MTLKRHSEESWPGSGIDISAQSNARWGYPPFPYKAGHFPWPGNADLCLGVFGQVDPISKSNGGPIALDLGTLTMPVSIPRNERYRDNLVILTIPG